jgi:hypothetical protein
VPEGFESAYAYARSCGSLARSFLGERASSLAASHRVGEAWRAVFAEAPPSLPEAELATAAERGIGERAIDGLRGIIGPLLKDEAFFSAMVRDAEYASLKAALSALAVGRAEPPEPAPLAPPLGFALSAYPDLDRMLRRTRYQWVIEAGLEDLPAVKNRLDRQYFSELWAAAKEVPASLAGSLLSLLRVEAELENLCWGLRLRRYYAMGAAEIESLLIDLPGVDVRFQALKAVSRRSDSRAEWAGWKWERLIPEGRRDGGDWYFNVRGFEAESRRYLFRKLYRSLHLEPDSYVPLYSYYRIKQHEAVALRGIIEGIKLEAPSAEIASFALASTGGA